MCILITILFIIIYYTYDNNTLTILIYYTYTRLSIYTGSSTRLHLQTDLAKRLRIQEERRQVLPITPPTSSTSTTTVSYSSSNMNGSSSSSSSSSEYDLEKHGLISDGLLDFDNGDFGHHIPTTSTSGSGK